jgi:chromate reductase
LPRVDFRGEFADLAPRQHHILAAEGFCPSTALAHSAEVFTDDGQVTDDATRTFLSGFMSEFRDHVARVLTVLPRSS